MVKLKVFHQGKSKNFHITVIPDRNIHEYSHTKTMETVERLLRLHYYT